MRRLFLSLVLVLASTACERRSSPSDAAVPSDTSTITLATCGEVPRQGLLRFPIVAGDNNTECDDPGARHFWLRVRSPVRMHFWAASVIIMPYHEERGLSIYGAGVAGSSRIEPESSVGRWLACEALAGNRPMIEVEMCAPSDRAAGFSVLAVFEPGHRQVAFVGNNPEQQDQVLELRGTDGTVFPLEPISFQRGGNTIQAFHVPGTPLFTAADDSANTFTFGDRPTRRRSRRHSAD
jgi:hypothetical protein